MSWIIACSAILFISSLFLLYKAYHLTIQKDEQQSLYNKNIEQLKTTISTLTEEKDNLLLDLKEQRSFLEKEYEKEKQSIEEQIALYKNNSSYASQQYVQTLEEAYEEAENNYDIKISQLKSQQQRVENDLKNLQDSLSAGVQAQLREREKEEKINFYKINISEDDLTDIKMLNQFKITFHNPMIINKLIWSNYFQKKVTEMCNRILGNRVVCGIYKITNLETKQCYIGQSVNIAERWKQHCKCGCDISAPPTNRLYQDMIKTGIWNFSFELMEECKSSELNQKEAFWIEMYQSDIYGLNSKKGNK